MHFCSQESAMSSPKQLHYVTDEMFECNSLTFLHAIYKRKGSFLLFQDFTRRHEVSHNEKGFSRVSVLHMMYEYNHAYSHLYLHSCDILWTFWTCSFTREEELMYLEFITDVTNEILTQGLYSDRCVRTFIL